MASVTLPAYSFVLLRFVVSLYHAAELYLVLTILARPAYSIAVFILEAAVTLTINFHLLLAKP